MRFQQGDFNFFDENAWKLIVTSGIMARYDVSVRAREDHDREIAAKYNRVPPPECSIQAFQDFCAKIQKEPRLITLEEGQRMKNPWR